VAHAVRTTPSRTRVALIAASVIAACCLSGCASSAPGSPAAHGTPTPTPEASASIGIAPPVTGVGPTGFPGVDFAIPAGARSVAVSFACAGGGVYSVELGDSMMLGQAPVSGTCDGVAEHSWPITEQTGPTLSVMVSEGVEWTATPTFSTDEFPFDTALSADCAQFASAYSEFMNADTGYGIGEVDAAEWTSRVDGAAAELEALASTSGSALADAFSEFHEIVTDPGRTVGAVVMTVGESPFDEISTACNSNQTPLVLKGEFGG